MSLIELILLAISLGMDSFAVSTCKGVAIRDLKTSDSLKLGLSFGFFQGFMTLIGSVLGTNFETYIEKIDHWIAFTLLVIIGFNMIMEGRKPADTPHDDNMSLKTLVMLGIATSIDALTVGIMLGILGNDVLFSSIIIAIASFIMAYCGSIIGHKIGTMFGKPAYYAGGAVLIGMGTKILLEHLGIISAVIK